MSQDMNHDSVLLEEALTALAIKADGCYLDATYGRGGHSGRILRELGDAGRLLVFDKDPQAIEHATKTMGQDARVMINYASYAELGDLVQRAGLSGRIDGLLLDAGVSSPQLDDPERGFSFTREGPLDMRMNPGQGISAADWLASASDKQIARVLKEYGEERYAKRIAGAIVRERQQQPIETTAQLADIVSRAHPAWEKGKHPATRSFQAIRIFINRELDELSSALGQALEVLAVGARMAVISFHSLEDRIVKNFIREQASGGDIPRHLPLREDQIKRRLKPVGKAIRASAREVDLNPRSRSAIMRVAEKLA